MTLFSTLTTILSFIAILSVASPVQKRGVAFFNPANGGGSELDNAGGGGGEPLNVIISGLSSPAVLTDSGFLNYVRSLGFSQECLGIHSGTPQTANLGDGHGATNQVTELRQDYGDAGLGTCLESLLGGNHLRMWRQNGPSANSGALFLAVSAEKTIFDKHTIASNGYNKGRDTLVNSATGGRTSFGGVRYSATVQSVTGLISPGSAGVNHGIAQDGVVKVLTVTIV
ncbi:hypothetical protein BD410DRAFT_788372 [Rickenella mellea]|uniref:Secreted protein n=1 Tax=Rickenella mellea TaxID=50990 RepID=A0A4Y7Q4P8_9AGAM|nr:hypothetical protein BD410DRAFT_788372 [Rickenella mellea]